MIFHFCTKTVTNDLHNKNIKIIYLTLSHLYTMCTIYLIKQFIHKLFIKYIYKNYQQNYFAHNLWLEQQNL